MIKLAYHYSKKQEDIEAQLLTRLDFDKSQKVYQFIVDQNEVKKA